MDARAQELMAETEERHWWWSARRAILDELLSRLEHHGLPAGPLYDLGCGSGSNVPVLRKHGEVHAFDSSATAVASAHSRGRREVQLADLAGGIEALRSFQLRPGKVVLLADVLEHLEDEQPALALAESLLAPGGALVVSVPALPLLWGPADSLNHHRRRYTRESLRAILEPRFAIERLTPFNFLLFAPILLARKLQPLLRLPPETEVQLPPEPLNRLLRALFSSEKLLLRHMDLPIGVSLLCVARKRAS